MATDNASPAFRRVGDEAEKAGKKTSAFGSLTAKAMKTAGAALAAAGIGSLFTGFIQDARESAKISRLTEAAIRSTGGAANVTARQVSELATALSNKTAIDDEAVQSASNLLLTFTRVRNEAGRGNDIFDQATASVLDMSTAMGTDANSAALTLGKALNDPIKGLTALGRAGVQFTEQQKEQIRTFVEAGDVLSAQKIILAELGTQFGGAAEAAADPLSRLAVVAGNLGEEVGGFLLPAIEGFADFVVDDLIPAFKDIVAVGSDVVGFIADIPGPVLAAVGALGGIALLKGPMSSFFDTVALRALYFRDSVSNASGVTGKLKGALGSLAGAFSPSTLGITAAVALLPSLIEGFRSFSGASDEAATAQQGFADALRETNGVIDDTSRSAAQRALIDADLVDTLDAAGVAADDAISGLLGNAEAQERVISAMNKYLLTLGPVAGGRNEEAEALRLARNDYRALADTLGITREEAEFFAGAIGGAGEATDAAAAATVEAAAEAEQALADWLSELRNLNEGFVEPLSVYKDLLSQKQEAERESAEATAAATDSGEDSWEDYAENVQVSLQEYATALMEQITAQENWRTNLVTISQRGGAEVAQILAEMGVEGAQITAQMASATEEDFQVMRDALIREAQLSGEGATDALATELAVMAAVGRDGASATARSIAEQLNLGVAEVQRIAAQYGVTLAAGVNPLLVALGKNRVSGVNGRVGGLTEADGGLVDFFANGSENHVAQIAPAGAWRVWAEPETGGEAYIPLSPSKRNRSTDIWRTVGERLGVQFQEFANGGFLGDADIPRPPSTAPYRSPISTAGDATMEKAYNDTRSWVAANVEAIQGGTAGGGAVGGAWTSLWQLVKSQIPAARINSTYRPGDPGYHGRNKAIDFGYGTGPGGLGSAGLASINRLLHDQVGRNLAELIYDGFGDDRPDLKNGRPLDYGAATAAQHRNHVHAAVYDSGGLLPPGLTLAYNGTGRNETVSVGSGPGGGPAAPAVFHLYDADGVLMGTMRGQAEAAVIDYSAAEYQRSAYNR